jgi:hypothetical protein
MSSEEMRAELEIFVNAGLQEGWRGWPLKSQEGGRKTEDRRRRRRPFSALRTRVWRAFALSA